MDKVLVLEACLSLKGSQPYWDTVSLSAEHKSSVRPLLNLGNDIVVYGKTWYGRIWKDMTWKNMERYMTWLYVMDIDSNWSLLLSKALKYYLDIYCEYFRVLHRFKHWPQNLKKSKIKTIQIKTLSLSSNLSPLVPLGQPKTGPGRPNHSRAPKWMKTDFLYENKKSNQKFSHRPQHSSNPLQAPPARLLTSSPPPCWLAGWQRVGGPPSSYPLISSPPPVLHSIHSHPSHLIPTIHQNCPLKVFNIHSFCHLSVQAAFLYTGHFHCKVHISPIVMMDAMQLEDRFVFILCFSVGQMLSSSWESISSRLPKIFANGLSTFFTN